MGSWSGTRRTLAAVRGVVKHERGGVSRLSESRQINLRPELRTSSDRRAAIRDQPRRQHRGHLDDAAVIAEYLTAAAEDPDPDVFLAALGDVAKARGMAQIAKGSGLGRESLYKALASGAHPRFETVQAVLRALGAKFAVVSNRS